MGRCVDDLRLALRAFRWRRGGSIVVLVAGALTVAAAALGPLFSSVAAESVLQDRLAQAEALETTIAFRVQGDVSYPLSLDVFTDEQSGRGSVPGYGLPVEEAQVETTAQAAGGLAGLSRAVYRTGACEHLEIVEGSCDLGPDDVVVAQRTADELGWELGSTLVLDGLRRYDTATQSGSEVATAPATVTVAGIYRPISQRDPFWAGRAYFPFHPNPEGPITVDSIFVSDGLFPTLVHPTPGFVVSDLVLSEPESLRVADVPTVRAAVERYLGPDNDGPRPTTGMLELLDRFEAERTDLALAAGVVTAQLALLAWLLLYLVVTDTSEARGSEVALAKLRGLPPRAVAAVALREPVVLLLLAVPLGLLLAYGLVVVLARAFLAPGVSVAFTPGTWIAVALAFLGGLVAAAIAARRMFTRPVLEQWSTTADTSAPARGGLVVDVVLAGIAVAGFVLLSRGTTDDPSSATSALAWLAPGLLVVAAGLLLVRLARPVLALLVRATRGSGRLGLFLGSRQAVRRPAGLRLAALLAVTIGLATFAVDAQASAAHSRDVRAGADIGAPTSVAVQQDPSIDLQQVVDDVDPDGRWAMVAADWIPSGGLAGRLLAVEPDRLAAVANWAPQYGDLDAAQVAALIDPPLPPAVPLTGDRVRLTIDASAVPDEAPDVLVSYRGADDAPTLAIAGPLRPGSQTYEAPLPCADQSCVLYGFVLDRAQTTTDDDVDLTGAAVQVPDAGGWKDVEAGLADPGSWRLSRYTGTVAGSLTAGADGLRLRGPLPPFSPPFVQYADVPDARSPGCRPCRASPSSSTTTPTGTSGSGLTHRPTRSNAWQRPASSSTVCRPRPSGPTSSRAKVRPWRCGCSSSAPSWAPCSRQAPSRSPSR